MGEVKHLEYGVVSRETEQETCPEGICDGSGYVEKMEYECNDSTGYNTVVSGTGKMERCVCNLDEGDRDE